MSDENKNEIPEEQEPKQGEVVIENDAASQAPEGGNKIKSGFDKVMNRVKNIDRAKVLRTTKRAASIAWQEGTTYIIFIVLVIFFECFNTKFLSGQNILDILRSSTYIVIAGMGIIFVMMTGGIDLSVGYIMATTCCVAAILLTTTGVPVVFVFIICMLIGGAMGSINGILAAKLKLFPLIITIATQTLFQGVVYLITNGTTYQGMPDAFRAFYTTKFLGMPIDFWITIVVVVLVWFILNKTHFGRNVLATGGNKECARLSGIRVDVITTACYAICGALFAFAACDMLAQQNLASASTGPGTEFTCLTAAIIGGISMMGGKGRVVGMVFGIFIMQIIANGMQLAGFNSYAQYIVKGAILILAVAFDVLKNMPMSRHKKKPDMPQQPPIPEGAAGPEGAPAPAAEINA